MSAPPGEFEALCNRLADGLASRADTERLGELLGEDPDMRRRYREFMELHAALHWDYVAAALPRSESSPAEPSSSGNSGSWKWAWRAWAAAAISALLTLGWFAISRDWAPHEPPAATLTDEHGCAWEGDSLAVGVGLRPGQALRLKRGVAEIRFGQGAVLVVRGPTKLEIVSSQAARLHDGMLSAMAPPRAVGFTVDAPGLKVVDLGTRFGLKVAAGIAEVHVFKGSVQASLVDPPRGRQAPRTVTLNSSEAVVVEPGKQTLAPIAAEVEAFAFDPSLSEEVAEPVRPVINGGSSWEGWTPHGASDQRGLYGSGSVRDVYRVYSTVFRFDRHVVSGHPVGSAGFGAGSRSLGAFAEGHTILGVGVEWVSGGRVTTPTVKFDLGNDSYAAASSVGAGDGRVDGSAHAGDFSAQFHYGKHWTPETLIVFNGDGKDELTGNMVQYDYAFRCFAVEEAETNNTKSYQLFFDLDAMRSLYGKGRPGVGVGRIGGEITIVINGYGSNQVVLERLPIVVAPRTRDKARAARGVIESPTDGD